MECVEGKTEKSVDPSFSSPRLSLGKQKKTKGKGDGTQGQELRCTLQKPERMENKWAAYNFKLDSLQNLTILPIKEHD